MPVPRGYENIAFTIPIKLSGQPGGSGGEHNVRFYPRAKDAPFVSVSPTLMTFTHDNWNTPQNLSVTSTKVGSRQIVAEISSPYHERIGRDLQFVDVEIDPLTDSVTPHSGATPNNDLHGYDARIATVTSTGLGAVVHADISYYAIDPDGVNVGPSGGAITLSKPGVYYLYASINADTTVSYTMNSVAAGVSTITAYTPPIPDRDIASFPIHQTPGAPCGPFPTAYTFYSFGGSANFIYPVPPLAVLSDYTMVIDAGATGSLSIGTITGGGLVRCDAGGSSVAVATWTLTLNSELTLRKLSDGSLHGSVDVFYDYTANPRRIQFIIGP